MMAIPGMEEIENQMQNMLGDIFPKKRENRRVSIAQSAKADLPGRARAADRSGKTQRRGNSPHRKYGHSFYR
jgi:ATP-dependent protease HslVU (ClpYQ) ATPase subunit